MHNKHNQTSLPLRKLLAAASHDKQDRITELLNAIIQELLVPPFLPSRQFIGFFFFIYPQFRARRNETQHKVEGVSKTFNGTSDFDKIYDHPFALSEAGGDSIALKNPLRVVDQIALIPNA